MCDKEPRIMVNRYDGDSVAEESKRFSYCLEKDGAAVL